VGIAGIDLWLFGGLARMKRESPSAWVDLKISAAGPLVTLVIAAVLFAVGAALAGAHDFWRAMLFEVSPVSPGEAVLADICAINTLLLVFNLLPGLPLDGGRMAMAAAWWRTGDRVRATHITAQLGRVVAWGLSAFAAYLLIRTGDVFYAAWLLFIAFFIAQSARAEEVWSQRVASQLDGLRVSDVMDPEPVAVGNGVKLDRALDEYFWRYREPWFPVTDNLGHLVGLVTLDSVEKVPEALRPGSTVDEVMARDPQSLKVAVDEPLESLLAAEGLHRMGALYAVDGDGVLRGVVTLDQVRRALRPPATVDTTA